MSRYCWTIVQSDSELFTTGDTSKNYHLSGIYLALIRNINLVTEFRGHWGRGQREGLGGGWETELYKGEETLVKCKTQPG